MPTHPRPWLAHGVHPLRSALGGAVGIALTALIGVLGARYSAAHGFWGGGPFLLASLGASAVLAFAVPASPLAQPRAIIGGNIVSGLAGVAVLRLLPATLDAATQTYAGIPRALGAAIVAMHLMRCLHPPGGAVALTPILGGPAIAKLGFGFVLYPLAANSLVLVAAAYAFNNLAGSRYPHRPPIMPQATRPAYTRADLDAVLDELDDLPDIEAEELDVIFRAVLARAASHRP